MAKHFSEVKRELEQSDGHMAGIGQQLKLSEEARDARNAGRRLEDETDETDLIGTVKKLEDLIAEQRRSNERIAREMRGMVSEMKDVLEKVEELRNGAADAPAHLPAPRADMRSPKGCAPPTRSPRSRSTFPGRPGRSARSPRQASRPRGRSPHADRGIPPRPSASPSDAASSPARSAGYSPTTSMRSA